MQSILLLFTVVLVLFTKTSQGIQNYKTQMNNAKLNVDQDDQQHEDIGQWLGNYQVGNQCSHNNCKETYIFNEQNVVNCPNDDSYGVIGYNFQHKQYHLSFTAWWFWSNSKMLILFDDSNKVKTKEGYKYKIPMHNGIDINIEPCQYGTYRDERFRVCPEYRQDPTLVFYKTYSDPIYDNDELKKCSVTFTRYYGYSKKCKKNIFLNTVSNVLDSVDF